MVEKIVSETSGLAPEQFMTAHCPERIIPGRMLIEPVSYTHLSSASENMNIVMAMNMGADDFIAKPFDLDVLTAKVQALLRRTYDFAPAEPVLSHRGAVLQPGDQSLLCLLYTSSSVTSRFS